MVMNNFVHMLVELVPECELCEPFVQFSWTRYLIKARSFKLFLITYVCLFLHASLRFNMYS